MIFVSNCQVDILGHRQPRLNGDTRRRKRRLRKKLRKKDIVRFMPSIRKVLATRMASMAIFEYISKSLQESP